MLYLYTEQMNGWTKVIYDFLKPPLNQHDSPGCCKSASKSGYLFFCHIWALGSRLKLQFILQVKYHILTYKNDRRKKWFSCLVYDIRHKEWTV